ncbi:MAG TPA: site-specific integrase [Pyrinomonadaceae bacterium]|nr:site-specific integrase [Pyrinomonadaceae bacterium]
MRKAILLYTDERCNINGRPQPGIPLLLNSERAVVNSVSDWFRYQAVMFNSPPTTLRLYSDIMLSFWNYLIKEGVGWTEVDDNVLMTWRNHQEIENGVKKRTINQRLSTVFQFYWWAQSHDYIQNVVPDPGNAESLAPAQISVAAKLAGTKSGVNAKFKLSSSLLYRTTREPNVHTPTAEEAITLHAALTKVARPTLAERNTLMLSWAEEAGLRRKEFASLTVDQIPDWNEIYDLIQQDSCKNLDLVVTKGGHHRIIELVPDLLLRTRNYIEEDRLAVVRRFKQKHGGIYKAPTAVFLSEKTGRRLTLGAITNLFREAFKKASVRGSGHRMRARYLTNLVQHYYDEAFAKHGNSISFDIVLLKAAEAAGHASPASLRPYLNLVRKRRLTTQDGERRRYLQQRLLSLERDLNAKSRQLETTTFVAELVTAIRSGNKSTIKRAWKNLEKAVDTIS